MGLVAGQKREWEGAEEVVTSKDGYSVRKASLMVSAGCRHEQV